MENRGENVGESRDAESSPPSAGPPPEIHSLAKSVHIHKCFVQCSYTFKKGSYRKVLTLNYGLFYFVALARTAVANHRCAET